MTNPPNSHLFEVLHYLSQEDESVEAYIDEEGEIVFEVDYDEFMKMIENFKEEVREEMTGGEDGELS